jgi:hypothetical protein
MGETWHQHHHHYHRTEWPGWIQPGQHSPPKHMIKRLAHGLGGVKISAKLTCIFSS